MITRRGILGAGALAPVLVPRRKGSRQMVYRSLSPVQKTSAADTTGGNQGNLTTLFPSTDLPNVRVYEIYHMTVTGGTFLAAAQILVNNRVFSTVQLDLSGANEWDPSATIKMLTDWELVFYWNLASSSTAKPVVTVWAQYDPSLPQNAGFQEGAF